MSQNKLVQPAHWQHFSPKSIHLPKKREQHGPIVPEGSKMHQKKALICFNILHFIFAHLWEKWKVKIIKQSWNSRAAAIIKTNKTKKSNKNISPSNARVLIHPLFSICPQALIIIITSYFSLAMHVGKYLQECVLQTFHSSFPTNLSSMIHASKQNHSEVVPFCLFGNYVKQDTWVGFQLKLQSAVFGGIII